MNLLAAQRYSTELLALSPIAHADPETGTGNTTNRTLFMTQAVRVDGVTVDAYTLSCNALRTRAVRYPLHDHLLSALGLTLTDLPERVRYLLYSGNNIRSGAKAPGGEMELSHAVHALYPSLDLLSGSADAFILTAGKLRLNLWPVAREYAGVLQHVAPHLVPQATESIYDMVTDEARTAGQGVRQHDDMSLYRYQVLAAGTRFFVEFTLSPHTPPATAGALAVALHAWDGYFGGQGRQGRGRMALEHADLPDPQPYLEHVEAHAEAMRQGLLSGRLGTDRVLVGAS